MGDQFQQWNSSSYEYGGNYHPPFKSKWVPLAGKKRKTPDDQDLITDERPPAKQFAIDDEVAPNIIKNGYIIDESDESNDVQCKAETKCMQLDDIEMEEYEDETENYYAGSQKSITGYNTNFVCTGIGGGDNISKTAIAGDDNDEDDDEGHAIGRMGLSQQINNMHQLGSVVLSEEVRASLAKKPSDDSTLSSVIPPSIVEQMYKNARAVVLWQPPQEPMSFISDSINNSPAKNLKCKQTDENQNHDDDDDEITESNNDSKTLYHRPLVLNTQQGVCTFESELNEMEVEGIPMSCGISQ